MKRTGLACAAALITGIIFLTVDVWSAAPKLPDKPMEFVVQVAAGGSSDLFVRQITKMITEQKLMIVPLTIKNEAGGGGSIANNYLKGKVGSPYYLLQASGSFISASLRDLTVPGYKDFTPIARLTIEVTSAVVRADSPYKTIKDVVDKAKKGKPGDINWAATGMGSHHHLTMTELEAVSGIKFSHVSFTGTNEVNAALLGGHVELASFQPSIAKPLVDAGKLRILGVASEKRVSSAPSTPTFKEQGFDVVVNSHRGFVAPGKIQDEAKNSLSEIFDKLSQSNQWKAYVASEGTELAFLPADEYKKFFVVESAKYEKLMRKAGLIK